MKNEMYDSMFRIETRHWWFCGKRDIVLSLAEPLLSQKRRPKLIDLGCGCGAMIKALEPYGDVTGVDFSDLPLAYCRERFGGTVKKLDLSVPIETEEQFDLGVALDILEHIDRDDIAAANIYALLRDGGHCIVTVPAYQWLWSSHDENCMHKRRYCKKQLEALLLNAGFKLAYISYYNCILFPAAAAVRLVSRCIRADRDSSLENHFRDSLLNRILYRIFSGEKKRISKRKTFPFGLSLIALVEKPGASA